MRKVTLLGVALILTALLAGCGEADKTPPVISEVLVSDITATSATITWTTSEPATGSVKYGIPNGGSYVAVSSVTSLELSLSHHVILGELEPLEPDTVYWFRVESKDASGNEATSEDDTFTTLPPPDTTAPAISNVTVSDITETTATITWTTDEPATSEVEYGLTTDYAITTPLDENLVTSHSISLSELDPDTTYHYRVKSEDASDNQAVSGEYTFTTTAPSNAELFSRAEQMLSEHGVTITDAEGDWIWTGDEEDNHSPYPVPWADLLSATFAVDADYLYFRLTVAGAYPSSVAELPWYGEDQIIHLSVNICLDTDNDKNTGCLADGGSEVVLETGMMINPLGEWTPGYDFWYGPTGVDSPETSRYAHMGNMNLVAAVWGGPGFDYCFIVYPVGSLGLYPGQTIAVNGWAECSSLQYTHQHATFDVLGPGGMNTRVVIQLPN